MSKCVQVHDYLNATSKEGKKKFINFVNEMLLEKNIQQTDSINSVNQEVNHFQQINEYILTMYAGYYVEPLHAMISAKMDYL